MSGCLLVAHNKLRKLSKHKYYFFLPLKILSLLLYSKKALSSFCVCLTLKHTDLNLPDLCLGMPKTSPSIIALNVFFRNLGNPGGLSLRSECKPSLKLGVKNRLVFTFFAPPYIASIYIKA